MHPGPTIRKNIHASWTYDKKDDFFFNISISCNGNDRVLTVIRCGTVVLMVLGQFSDYLRTLKIMRKLAKDPGPDLPTCGPYAKLISGPPNL
jgi:hypothetical protein